MTRRTSNLIFSVCLLLFTAALPGTNSRADSLLPAAGIATAHPLATDAGHKILQAGGNAFDAAVAITATLAVVEPMSSGLGGGGFWLLHREEDQYQIMIDGRETAPQAAHRDMYLDANGEVIEGLSMDGPLAAAIPGIPAAIVHIAEKYGKLSLQQNLAPAISYAENGFAVDEHYQRMAKFRLKAIQASPAAAAVLLQNNKPPEAGFIVKQPDLAITLKALATQGFDGFYKGAVAQKLVQGVKDAKGIWTLEDLTNYKIVERPPIVGNYHDMQITSAAPPSSGGIALLTMLNILSGYPLNTLDKVQRTHLIVEAMRRAYRDRAIYLGDPDFVDIPSLKLLNTYYAAGLRAGIHPEKATPSDLLPGIEMTPQGKDTTHFSVIDKQGNRVAATLTINYPFGSGFMPPGTGVLLNDEMDDFSAKPGTPNAYGLVGAEANAIAPGKRPLSSMSPTFIEDERGVAVLGTPGGSRIITMVLLAILDYANGGTPHSMVSLPRFHHQYLPDVIQYEKGAFSDKEIKALQAEGHTLEQTRWAYGNMQAVMWLRHENKVLAASDPRVIGKAEVK
ncbi:MAG: gamma-glutamyltransferase [Gammaproteobacteria bacterium]